MERKHLRCPFDDGLFCDVIDWDTCDRCDVAKSLDPEDDDERAE